MSWLDWVKLAYGVYKDQNPKQGQFVMPPTSPAEEKILGTTSDWLTGGTPSSRILGPAAAEFGKSTMPSFTMPGYVGSEAGKNPMGANGGTSTATMDWDAVLKRMMESQAAGGKAPVPGAMGSTGGNSTTSVSGDPFGSQSAPAGTAGDPFANWPTGGSSPYTPLEKQQFIDFAKKYGGDAVKYASMLADGNPLLSGAALFMSLKNYIQSRGGEKDQTLPVNDLSGKVDLTPAPPGYTPRDPYNVPFADQQSSLYARDFNNNLMSGPGSGSAPDPFSGSNVNSRKPLR
jgi:hypothetical protein